MLVGLSVCLHKHVVALTQTQINSNTKHFVSAAEMSTETLRGYTHTSTNVNPQTTRMRADTQTHTTPQLPSIQ